MAESVNEKADVMKVPVRNLALGMYVAAIDHQGRVNITNPGQIKDRQAIEKLVRNGIQYVWVDLEKSAPGCGLKPRRKPEKTMGPTREQSQDKAKRLMSEAKDLVKKVMSETFEGKAVEVAPFEALADKSLLRIGPGVADDLRARMLETIHAFAAERLADDISPGAVAEGVDPDFTAPDLLRGEQVDTVVAQAHGRGPGIVAVLQVQHGFVVTRPIKADHSPGIARGLEVRLEAAMAPHHHCLAVIVAVDEDQQIADRLAAALDDGAGAR